MTTDLRWIRNTLDFKTASTVTTALVHSKLDYYNSQLNLPAYETQRLQYIQNSLARAICRTYKFTHITPPLKVLHWLKIRERIEYKIRIASLTFTAALALLTVSSAVLYFQPAHCPIK